MSGRSPRKPLAALVATRFPEVDDPDAAIEAGHVRVDGVVVHNPRSLVSSSAAVVLVAPRELRGAVKLRAILDALGGPAVEGRVALDVGASTGGFTSELLDRGVVRVYAVDTGHGQLLGSLRQDRRVVNLENVNAGDLDRTLVPEPVDVVVVDVSMSPLAVIVPQVSERVDLAPGADLVALVKPMFELQRGELPTSDADYADAVSLASAGIAAAGWRVVDAVRSPVTGARGAVEFAVRASR